MRAFFVFIYSFITFLFPSCLSQEVNSDLRLIVSPSGHIVGLGPPILVRKVDESLNLTCRLVDQKHDTLPNYNISWNWQYSQGSNANRVMMMSMSHNAANLVFKSLKETDSGEYTCKCGELDLTENVWVKVKAFKRTCSDKMFTCSNGNCIGRHFVCDGKPDCKFGIDEDFEHCGINPCEGKIPCENGRCIPTSWCCDEDHDPNCTTKVKPKCCQQLARPFSDIDSSSYLDHQFGDMGFLQTTIYTVIGCAMAFMFIVTILVIAICRVHLKRTVISRCPLSHQHQHLRPGSPLRPPLPLYDLDMFLERPLDSGSLLVTYNINNGVQFVGRPVDPPPYCEIVDAPPREGPPPPYISRENISQQNENAEAEENDKLTNSNEEITNPEVSTVDSKTTFQKNLTALSLCDISKCNSSFPSAVCSSSVPSVSGLSKLQNKNLKKNVLTDFSDSESDSSYMENDALLLTNEDSKPKTDNSSTSGSFLNNFTTVSKNFIGSLSKKEPQKGAKKPFKPLLTQKSFDSSERTFDKIVPSVAHSLGDLSPVSAEANLRDFSDRREFLTLPLRESFIGVRSEEA